MTVTGPRQNTPRLRPPSPREGVRRRTGTSGNPIILSGATSWYDAHDGSGLQEIPSRIGAGVATLGSTTGVDTNDPTWTAGSGVPYWSWDATDDYMLLDTTDTPTFTATVGAYAVLILAQFTYVGVRILWSSESAANNGATMFPQTSNYNVRVGAALKTATTAFTGGVKQAHGLCQDNGTLRAYDRTAGYSTGLSTTGASTTHVRPKIGIRAYDNALSWGNSGRIYAVVTWNGIAPTQGQMDSCTDYLLTSFT